VSYSQNVNDSGIGYVTMFRVKKEFVDRYTVEKVGGANHTEWWVPAEDLEDLNDNIVGEIEVLAEYRKKNQPEPFSGI